MHPNSQDRKMHPAKLSIWVWGRVSGSKYYAAGSVPIKCFADRAPAVILELLSGEDAKSQYRCIDCG